MLDPAFEALLRKHVKYLSNTQPLDEDHLLQEYGLDSLASVNLLLDIEDTYDIVMPDKYLVEATFSTAHALWNVIEQLRA
jgi:acyl carrier protein